jgi:ribulose-phosphate 3-epimerase
MPFWEDIDFELDLMVTDAIENFDIYSKLGAKRIVFHLNSFLNIEDFKNFLEGIDVYLRESLEIGVALNIDVSLEKVFPLLNDVDFVQCMGIHKVGFQGQEFDKKVIKNIKILREKFSDIVISVDGGINFETASLLIKAGVNRLIIGSVLLNSENIIEALEELKNLG